MTANQPKTRLGRIVHRMAGVVQEMNYAQRRSLELYLGLGEGRR